MRVLYYAVMPKGRIPLIYTGTAVGIISVIGYTPEIFFGPLTGRIIDKNPGEIGFQYVFAIMAGFALVGLITSIIFKNNSEKSNDSSAISG